MHYLDEENLKKIALVRSHLEKTKDEDWCLDVVRSKDQNKNCFFGHVFNIGKNDKEGSDWWHWTEAVIGTTYMVYPINDGTDKRYPQSTPRKRMIAHIDDILSGKEKSGLELWMDHQ